jgi:hypothetical protein
MARFAAAVGLLVTALLLAGSTAPPALPQPLRVLQLNLCNSGIAGCYTGRAIPAAAQIIRDVAPDVVTLNEICEHDVDTLKAAMRGPVVAAFMAAPDRPSGDSTRCRTGQAYGIGLLVRLAPGPKTTTRSGVYAAQDGNDPEIRVWLCIAAVKTLTACTTHLATSIPIALEQCSELFAQVPAASVVIGGDFNLRDAGCVPETFARTGDGTVQHVLASADLRITGVREINLSSVTDHPGLLVSLRH